MQKQLYGIPTYIKLLLEEMEILIAKIKAELLEVVNRNLLDNFCLKKEKEFVLSKFTKFMIPHFYVI